MARPRSIDEDALIARLSRVFRDAGFHGASLAQLAKAAGLQKASLYHRFPGGKAQMADEVLSAALAWVGDNIIAPLSADGPPEDRLAAVVAALDRFYDGGTKACLLNMLSSPLLADGPFAPAIRAAFGQLTDAFARLARDAGWPPDEAARRGRRVVMLLQGSLVLTRGLGADAPFREFLDGLPEEILNRKTSGRAP